jgi:hypothetical protein
MKKLIPLCIVGIVVLSGLGAVAQSVTEHSSEKMTLRFSEPVIQTENHYVSVAVTETNSFIMSQGKPLLPSYTTSYTFPFGTTITSVTVTPQQIQTKTISGEIQPTPERVALDQTSAPTVSNTPVYNFEQYPSSWFEYTVGSGRVGNELCIIVDLSIYPVQYYPAGNLIQWAQQVNVVINYEPASPHATSSGDSYQFVVIGPSDYSSQLAPLINHKISRGITSKFVSLTDIYGGTYFPATGRDNQEKIKYFIKNAIESWTTASVLLVGGSSKFPVRQTHVVVDTDNEVFTSDLYYADIYNGTGGFCSWDSNGNDIFGEFHWQGRTDDVDLHPDVYLARLAATSSSQVTACVNKIITYENNPGYQQSWFTTLVVVGGDSFEDDDGVNEGEYANQNVIDIMGFASVKLWASNGMLTTWVPTGVTNIKNVINDGCGFVDFSGHGNTNIWASHPHNDFSTWIPTPLGGFFTSDIQTLSNGNKLPIITVEACSTAKFSSDANCFNWALLSNTNGGAIGTFGCTGLGYGYPGTYVTQGLIGKIGLDIYRSYKLDQATSFGELWARALNRYIHSGMDDGDYKTVEEWQAFGDPTLAIGEPSQPPAQPDRPNGPASGNVNTEYSYTSSTTDPDGDKVSYMFDWGDGTYSSWIGPLNSGATVTAKKTWTKTGNYSVKVVAKDSHGITGEWSDPLAVGMPLSYKIPFMHLLEQLFERFPHAFPLLRHLLGF